MTVVEKGVLKTFLMSRSPIQGIDHSNGHGRREPGYEVVSRQSNLIVESSNAVSDARLRQMLIEEVKRQNKPYGLYFRDITGGFTTTARSGLQAFKVIPVVVFRVYPDGRPDEHVDLFEEPRLAQALVELEADGPARPDVPQPQRHLDIDVGMLAGGQQEVPLAVRFDGLRVGQVEPPVRLHGHRRQLEANGDPIRVGDRPLVLQTAE